MKNTRGEREGGRQPPSQTAASVINGSLFIKKGGGWAWKKCRGLQPPTA